VSLSGLTTALLALLRQTDLPVYLSDQLPHHAALPYLTCLPPSPAFGQTAPVTVSAWFREPDAHAQRQALGQRLRALIPEGGAALTFPGGMASLHRAGSFLTLDRDDADPRVLCLRARLTLRLYDL